MEETIQQLFTSLAVLGTEMSIQREMWQRHGEHCFSTFPQKPQDGFCSYGGRRQKSCMGSLFSSKTKRYRAMQRG